MIFKILITAFIVTALTNTVSFLFRELGYKRLRMIFIGLTSLSLATIGITMICYIWF